MTLREYWCQRVVLNKNRGGRGGVGKGEGSLGKLIMWPGGKRNHFNAIHFDFIKES